MSQTIVVIDYGLGNLRSVSKAVEHVADPADRVLITDSPEAIRNADRIVFPGQGAARDCMAALSEHQVNQAVLEAARTKPFFGICMGMQVLLEFSEENGGTKLMGLIPGQVRRFAEGLDPQGGKLKIPQMGWNRVRQTQTHPIWAGVPDDSRFYFVHSYFVDPVDASLTAGSTEYGITYTSAIARDNLFATQFHPEKSADHGLQLLRNFLSWKP